MTQPNPTQPVSQTAGSAPWSWKIEPQHYPECDDADLPAVVRDGTGKEVVWLPERYDDGPVHERQAALIVEAVNAHLAAQRPASDGATDPRDQTPAFAFGALWYDADFGQSKYAACARVMLAEVLSKEDKQAGIDFAIGRWGPPPETTAGIDRALEADNLPDADVTSEVEHYARVQAARHALTDAMDRARPTRRTGDEIGIPTNAWHALINAIEALGTTAP